MPKFKVRNRDFWDGVTKHPPGTVIEIDKEDYDSLLCLDFIPMDEQAKKDLKRIQDGLQIEDKNPDSKTFGQMVKLKYNPLYLEASGTLDPNKKDDLRKLHPKGARVVPKTRPKKRFDEGGEEDDFDPIEAVVPQTSVRSGK